MDKDGSDIFAHYDDFQFAGITKDLLKKSKKGYQIRFSFSRMTYIGKYKESKKAVEIEFLSCVQGSKSKEKNGKT